jgi:hypothetical protein
MNIRTPLSAALLLTLMSQTYANDYTAPRTEWGHPELRGVWNFSSSIPMQRPAALGDRAFYTVEEVQAQEQARIQREQAGIELTNIIGGTIGGYNDLPRASDLCVLQSAALAKRALKTGVFLSAA